MSYNAKYKSFINYKPINLFTIVIYFQPIISVEERMFK